MFFRSCISLTTTHLTYEIRLDGRCRKQLHLSYAPGTSTVSLMTPPLPQASHRIQPITFSLEWPSTWLRIPSQSCNTSLLTRRRYPRYQTATHDQQPYSSLNLVNSSNTDSQLRASCTARYLPSHSLWLDSPTRREHLPHRLPAS